MHYIITILAIFTGEFFWKNHIEAKMPENGSKKALHGTVILTNHHNRGAALNAGEQYPEIMKWISAALTAVAAVLFLCCFKRSVKRTMKWGLSFLLGGASSNTYDRLKRGYVVDYFRLNVPMKRIRNIIFNLSDFCIMLGAALITMEAAKER